MNERTIIDYLLERPYIVELGQRRLSFFPPSLGVLLQAEAELPISPQRTDEADALAVMLATAYPTEVARYLALHTCRTRAEAQDESKVSEVAQAISTLKADELTSLFLLVRGQSDASGLMEMLGIDDNLSRRKKAIERRATDSWESFGGLSIYGSLIDPLAERYGWTMDYILWGISYANIQLLLSDQPTSIYSADAAGKHLDADDPKREEELAQLFSL